MDIADLRGKEKDRSKDKLKRHIESSIKKLFTGVLDYTEVAIDNKDRWKVLRSRILKLSNNTIRDIFKEIDSRYNIDYDPPGEDILVVQRRRK